MSPVILYSGFSNFFNKKVPSRQANNSVWRHTTVNISLKRDKVMSSVVKILFHKALVSTYLVESHETDP